MNDILLRIQNLQRSAGIALCEFSQKTGIEKRALNTSYLRCDLNDDERERIEDILFIFDILKEWHDSSTESWRMFTQKKIRAFGDVTASQAIALNKSGIRLVCNYLQEKKLGGYE